MSCKTGHLNNLCVSNLGLCTGFHPLVVKNETPTLIPYCRAVYGTKLSLFEAKKREKMNQSLAYCKH